MEYSICIFGASSTQGFYDIEKGGWADRLKAFLYEMTLKGDDYYEVFNLGISGNTSKDLLDRFDDEAKRRDPTIVVISLGDNDSAFGVSLSAFEKNMQKIIGKAKKYTKNILIVGCKKVNEKLTSPVEWDESLYYSNEKIKQYDNTLKMLAEKNKISYLRIFDLLSDDGLEDGLHPNSRGHEKIFQKVKDHLTQSGWI